MTLRPTLLLRKGTKEVFLTLQEFIVLQLQTTKGNTVNYVVAQSSTGQDKYS